MVTIKEEIRRIKKGDMQSFVKIVEKHIDRVYFICKAKYGDEKSEELTKDIFINLYNSIVRFGFFSFRDNIDEILLKRICNRYKLNYELISSIDTEKAPPIVLRKLLIALSSKSKRKNILSTIVVGCSLLLVVIFLIVSMSSLGRKHVAQKRTLVAISSTPESIYKQQYNKEEVEIRSISSLGSYGIAVDSYLLNGEHFIHLWSEGKLVKSMKISKDLNFITGNMKNDYFVFQDKDSIYRYDSNGRMQKSVKISGEFLVSSPNKRYIVLRSNDDTSIILDTFDMTILNEIYGKFFNINDHGQAIYHNDETNIFKDFNIKERNIISVAIDEYGNTIVAYKNGLVEKYVDGSLSWKSQISFPTTSKGKDIEISNAYILNTIDKINIVIEYESGIMFQSLDLNSGVELMQTYETMHSGKALPYPKLSTDGRMLLISSKMPNDNISVRYNGVIDTKHMPMREYNLVSDDKLLFVDIEQLNNKYFVYQFSENAGFEIKQISIDD